MQLLASWRESLMIFKPGNFKLFCLVTLNSMRQTYKVWFSYWWWIIAAFIGAQFLFPPISALNFLWAGPIDFMRLGPCPCCTYSLFINGALFILALSLLVLSCRPSVALKNMDYFTSYFSYFFYVALWFLGLSGWWWFIVQGGFILYAVLVLIEIPLLIALSLFFMLFLFDSDGTVQSVLQSVWNALKMLFYNLPFIMIVMLALYLILDVGIGWLLLSRLISVFTATRENQLLVWRALIIVFEFFITVPLLVNVVTNLYIKRLHEQFQLYFS